MRLSRGDMHPVDDELHDDVGSRERRSDDSRIAVVERTHRVEEVRHAPHAEIEGARSPARRSRPSGRPRRRSRGVQPLDDLVARRELRRERDETDRPRVEEPLEQSEVGVAASGRRMDPEAQSRQERPFEMRAEDARPVRLSRHLAEGGEELLFGGRDEGREVGSDAGLEERFPGAGDIRRRRR